jgi:SAM-dependent methyltransferase
VTTAEPPAASEPATVYGSSQILPLPPTGMRFMGESDEAFLTIARGLVSLAVEYGLADQSSVLDIGCGYGRVAVGILASRPYRGRYLGFDILRRQVRWCSATITPIAPNMRFTVLDVKNDRYNPKGRLDPVRARFPVRSRSIDICVATSLFTHLDLPTTQRYLRETCRALRPGAVAVTTWFLFDEARLASVTSDQCKFPMRTRVGTVNRTAFPDAPLRAIAFEEAWLRREAEEIGLEVVTIEHGRWDGSDGRTTQDLVVLRRVRAREARESYDDATATIREALELRVVRRLASRTRRALARRRRATTPTGDKGG